MEEVDDKTKVANALFDGLIATGKTKNAHDFAVIQGLDIERRKEAEKIIFEDYYGNNNLEKALDYAKTKKLGKAPRRKALKAIIKEKLRKHLFSDIQVLIRENSINDKALRRIVIETCGFFLAVGWIESAELIENEYNLSDKERKTVTRTAYDICIKTFQWNIAADLALSRNELSLAELPVSILVKKILLDEDKNVLSSLQKKYGLSNVDVRNFARELYEDKKKSYSYGTAAKVAKAYDLGQDELEKVSKEVLRDAFYQRTSEFYGRPLDAIKEYGIEDDVSRPRAKEAYTLSFRGRNYDSAAVIARDFRIDDEKLTKAVDSLIAEALKNHYPVTALENAKKFAEENDLLKEYDSGMERARAAASELYSNIMDQGGYSTALEIANTFCQGEEAIKNAAEKVYIQCLTEKDYRLAAEIAMNNNLGEEKVKSNAIKAVVALLDTDLSRTHTNSNFSDARVIITEFSLDDELKILIDEAEKLTKT